MKQRKCYNCDTVVSPNWYSPHWIAMKFGYHYCESCFTKLYPDGDRFCGLRKEKLARGGGESQI